MNAKITFEFELLEDGSGFVLREDIDMDGVTNSQPSR